jgi:hypothetical protein
VLFLPLLLLLDLPPLPPPTPAMRRQKGDYPPTPAMRRQKEGYRFRCLLIPAPMM